MNDLIKRSDAIKEIMDLPNCENGYSGTYDKQTIIVAIEDVPTVNQWIKCSDRLPQEAGEYLIAVEMMDGSYEADMDIFNGKKWRYAKRRDVIAWMPLPQYSEDE